MTSGVVKLNDTGERVRYFVRRSWKKIYYSFDHQLSWHLSRTKALEAARGGNRLAVIDRQVVMPDGSIAIAR